jgi:hypothetical protein
MKHFLSNLRKEGMHPSFPLTLLRLIDLTFSALILTGRKTILHRKVVLPYQVL